MWTNLLTNPYFNSFTREFCNICFCSSSSPSYWSLGFPCPKIFIYRVSVHCLNHSPRLQVKTQKPIPHPLLSRLRSPSQRKTLQLSAGFQISSVILKGTLSNFRHYPWTDLCLFLLCSPPWSSTQHSFHSSSGVILQFLVKSIFTVGVVLTVLTLFRVEPCKALWLNFFILFCVDHELIAILSCRSLELFQCSDMYCSWIQVFSWIFSLIHLQCFAPTWMVYFLGLLYSYHSGIAFISMGDPLAFFFCWVFTWIPCTPYLLSSR